MKLKRTWYYVANDSPWTEIVVIKAQGYLFRTIQLNMPSCVETMLERKVSLKA